MASSDQQTDEIVAELRQQLFDRGAKGMHGLSRAFRLADDNGNRALDQDEFEEVLAYAGLFLKRRELAAVFRRFDRNGDGSLSVEEFLRGVRGDMNERRTALVRKAFDAVDRDGSGVLTLEDVSHLYNASRHPAVLRGQISEGEAVEQLLQGFEGTCGNRDGAVTWEEWRQYYSDLSASIPDDRYFVSLIESVWMLRESDSAADNERLARLEDVLREKVRQKSMSTAAHAGRLRKVFKFFDADEGGTITIDEFASALERFGLCLERRDVSAFFARFDPDGSGTITYEEFIGAIFPED